MKVIVPPIKCQGIKSKLVEPILAAVQWDDGDGAAQWIEPFMGSGVVGFNAAPKSAVFCDANPHIIGFYDAINSGDIDAPLVQNYLRAEGDMLSAYGSDYYYEVRNRFNARKSPLDFLFLNRSCFNGLIRFNGKGEFNVPFGHKPQRFSKAYITKIANQVRRVAALARSNDWTFVCQDFRATLAQAAKDDLIYCDPPYAGRHSDYFNQWSDADERALNECLSSTDAKFILSTWHSNRHRTNPNLTALWAGFNIITKEHFYHVGAKQSNRNPMLEALVTNFEAPPQQHRPPALQAHRLNISVPNP